MVCLGQETVGWLQNYGLEEPIWPPLPKEGVIQWWGGPETVGIING